MLKQQSFPETPETPVTITQHPETAYSGTCYGQPCYELPEGMTVGLCTKMKVYIMLDLAKLQRLCDHEETAYSKAKENLPCGKNTPTRCKNTTKPTKTKTVTKKKPTK